MAKQRRAFDEIIRPGNYLVPLQGIVTWYTNIALSKGVTYDECNVKKIIDHVLAKVFDNEYCQDELNHLFRYDLIGTAEAEKVQKHLEDAITCEVVTHFPTIAMFVPKEYFKLYGTNLVIHVPKTIEEQRGIFV